MIVLMKPKIPPLSLKHLNGTIRGGSRHQTQRKQEFSILEIPFHRHATEISENTLLFDNFSTSKALDNPYFADSLALFAKQERYRSVVLFNNGLHGFHLNDSLFERYYRKMIVYLKESFRNIPIMVVLSTTVGDTERRACIIRRNAIAQKIANENGLDVIDLFEASERMTELQTADLVHFNEEGFHALAKIVVDAVKTHLSAKVNK